MELQGRVALVTGGAGGIGGAVVRSLAKAGVSGVAINYRKSAKDAEELAAEIERTGVKAIAIQADVQSDDQVRAMIGKIREQFGRLDILVNNAGVTHWVKLRRSRRVDRRDLGRNLGRERQRRFSLRAGRGETLASEPRA